MARTGSTTVNWTKRNIQIIIDLDWDNEGAVTGARIIEHQQANSADGTTIVIQREIAKPATNNSEMQALKNLINNLTLSPKFNSNT